MATKKNILYFMLCMLIIGCTLTSIGATAADNDKPYLGAWADTSGKQTHTYIFSDAKTDYKINGKSQRKFPSPASYAQDGDGYMVTLSGMKFFYLECKTKDTMDVCDAWNKKNCVTVTRVQ